LDLGCGDGTTALPEAKLGAQVLGVDIAANLVAAGNKRAAAAGLSNLKFQEGDASELEDLDDKSFDLVVSIFGAMFAPKPFEAASKNGKAEDLQRELRELFARQNTAKDRGRTSIPATFLRVTVRV